MISPTSNTHTHRYNISIYIYSASIYSSSYFGPTSQQRFGQLDLFFHVYFLFSPSSPPGFTGLHRAQVWKQVAELAAVGGLARGSSVTGSSHSLAQEWDSEGTVVPVPVTDKLGDEATCLGSESDLVNI